MKINKKWIKVMLFVLSLAVAIGIIYLFLPKIIGMAGYLITLFLPFLFGYVFAMAVNPLADMLQKKLKIPRGFSAILVMVLIIGILGGVLTFAVWKIVSEVRMLYNQFPEIYASMQESIHSFGNKWSVIYDNLPYSVQTSLSQLGSDISARAAEFINTKSTPMVDTAGDFAKALPKGFIAVVVFLLSSYFMVSEHKTVSRYVVKKVNPKILRRWIAVKNELKKNLGGYLKAQGILMLIAFMIILIGLSLLDINYALLIALGIAVLDALPFFGSGAVLWPWTAVAFINGDITLGVGLIIIYLAVMFIRRFAEPKLVSNGLGLHPIPALMSMYVGYKTMSLGGLILGPIILMLIISFYKAGIFDAPIYLCKYLAGIIKKQFISFKKFLVNLMESDWDE